MQNKPKNFLFQIRGGVAIWEKFPNNPIIFLRAALMLSHFNIVDIGDNIDIDIVGTVVRGRLEFIHFWESGRPFAAIWNNVSLCLKQNIFNTDKQFGKKSQTIP